MSASRQIRLPHGTGNIPAGDRKVSPSPPSSINSGRSLSARIGKYDVEVDVGGGALVRVFHACDRATGRRVTLKVLTDVADASRVERFRREVAAVANVRHANLVSIYELAEHVGMPFAALEFLGDDHLADALAAHRRFTLLETMRLMWQVAEGLQAAHQGGLAYVGLRPSGIALCSGASAKIRDFGIVRLTPDASGEAARYDEVTPEGRRPDALSDVFSFGIIYYELLTGSHPGAALVEEVAGCPIVRPVRDSVPDCPEPLEQLVARALDPDRSLRYQSLDDLQYDAEPILRELERDRAAVMLDEARRWMESQELDKALTAVRDALELDSGNSGAQRLRGELRALVQERTLRSRLEALLREAEQEAGRQRFTRAAELLGSAARLEIKDAEAARHLEEIRSRLEQRRRFAQLLDEVRRAMEEDDLAAAESKVLEALEQEPENAEAAALADAVGEAMRRRELEARLEQDLAEVKSLLLLESFDAALEILSRLEQECPEWPEIRQWLAHVAQQKQQHERRARLEARLGEARSLLDQRRFEEAAEVLEELRAGFPREPAVSDLLAECRVALQRAAVIDQARAQCDALCHQLRFDEALAVVDRASSACPDDPELSALRRAVEQRRSEFQAADLVRQVLEETEWLLDQDRVDLAVQFLREKLSEMPDQPVLASRLAEVEALQPEWERRQSVADTLRRVVLLEQAQQWPVALTVVEEALEAYPDAPELRQALERLQTRLREQERRKKLARAVAEVRQALADGDTQQAEQALRNSLAALPDEPALLELTQELERDRKFHEEFRTAQVLVGRRQFDKAEAILVRLDGSQHPEVEMLLKTVREACAASEEQGFYRRGREKALHLIQQGQIEQAADMLRNLLSLFPGDPILERDLHAIVRRQRPEKPPAAEPAAVTAEPAPPPADAIVAPPVALAVSAHPRSTGAPALASWPVLPAWARGRSIIAGAALILLVSAGAGLARRFRAPAVMPLPAARKVSILSPAPAAVPRPTMVAGSLAPVPRTAAVARRERGADEPRETPSAASPTRPFNLKALSKTPAKPASAAIVPPPPAANVPTSYVDVLALPAGLTSPLAAPAPPREAPAPNRQASRVIGGNLQPVRAISLPPPVTPLVAKERHISGIVTLDATVDKRGAVTNIKVVSGNPLLVSAARDAVARWRYQPAVLNGEPIDAQVHIELRFESNPR